jgi:hypothetical protein
MFCKLGVSDKTLVLANNHRGRRIGQRGSTAANFDVVYQARSMPPRILRSFLNCPRIPHLPLQQFSYSDQVSINNIHIARAFRST